MKLCIFTNHFFPESFKVNDIAFELCRRGHDVTVLTAIPDYPQGDFYRGYSLIKKRREVIDGVKIIRIPHIPRGKGKSLNLIVHYLSFLFCLSIFTLFHSVNNRYDKIFVHVTSPFFVCLPAVLLKRLQKIPLILWILDLWPESLISAGGINSKIVLRSQNRMVANVYNKCDRILIGSQGFSEAICGKGNFGDKLIYFPNWAESIDGRVDESLVNAIAPYSNAASEDFIILFAGNIGEAQNLEAVIYAAARLKENKNIKFVFVGDGRRMNAMISLGKKLDAGNVYFAGRFPIDKMSSFIARSNVLLVSLKNEQCFNFTVPAKVQFYMAQGKPILAMLNGDGARLIREANCGISINAGDTDALVQSILRMYEMSKDELSRLGDNGKEYYCRFFRKELRMDQLHQILNDI